MNSFPPSARDYEHETKCKLNLKQAQKDRSMTLLWKEYKIVVVKSDGLIIRNISNSTGARAQHQYYSNGTQKFIKITFKTIYRN